MKAIITLKINDNELGIIAEALRRYNILSVGNKESMKLLNDLNAIEVKLEKELKKKDKGER